MLKCAGKIIIDITNPFNASATELVTPDGTSGAQEIAKAVPASAHVGKAFNTVFGHVLAQGRPLDTGDLAMAHWLEGAGLLLMGLARHGVGFNFDLGVNVSG